jgi:hypothetical protein
MHPFDMLKEPFSGVFQELLDKAGTLEEQDLEFVKLLEHLYLAIISGPLARKKGLF